MSYYVQRQNRETGRVSFVGPIRSTKQAFRESDAWVSAGFAAWVRESTPEVRAEVRRWDRDKDAFNRQLALLAS